MATMNRFLSAICAAVVLAATLAGCAPAPQSPAGGDDIYGRIDAWVQSEMKGSGIPGLALGIVQGSEIVCLKGYGKAGPEGRPVSPQTPFVIASVSKSITALAVMQLAEAGKVQLDAPVVTYLPGFKTADSGASAKITVRQLLNQTSGLSTFTGIRLNYNSGGKPLDDLVGSLAGEALASAPGGPFHYSNANYILLADIVEHVSGQPYGDYVREHVFASLGMANSAVEPDEDLQRRMASGHQPWFGFPVAMKPYRHTTCLNNISTVEDMTKLLVAYMNGGSYAGASVCTLETIAEMQKPAALMRNGVSYGMGLEIDSTGPYAIIRHPGDAPGYNANIAILPEGDWGIVVLQNTNWLGMEGETGRIIRGIEAILQDRDPERLPASPGTIRMFFNAVYVVTLFFLILALLRLKRWKARMAGDGRQRLRRRLIPVIMINFSMPIGMLLFLPKFFSADWAQGFLNAPDFSMMMILISVLLLALSGFRVVAIIRQMAAGNEPTPLSGSQQ